MPTNIGFHRILAPVVDTEQSQRAVDVACRLASSGSGVITLLAVVEVPQLLPFNAHMADEELRAHLLIERMSAIVESYDIAASRRIVRAREASAAIVAQAEATGCELIVLGAVSGRTTAHVLKHAACRVMLVGDPSAAVAAANAAA
jgi:basic amino acid/polyamine antiporter, APA family